MSWFMAQASEDSAIHGDNNWPQKFSWTNEALSYDSVFVPLEIHILKSYPQYGGIRRWGFGGNWD